MKILIATDFSEQAEKAIRTGAALARRFGDEVVLAHVLEPPTTNILEIGADARIYERALREAADRSLAASAASVRATGLSVETILLEGAPDEALTKYAQQIEARLIALGSHGRRAPWRWFVGSVAERTEARADRPVLIIREGQEGIGEWSAKRALRVVVALDLGASADAAITWVRQLRKAGACDVTFIHVARPYGFALANEPLLGVVERELLSKVGELPGEGAVEVRIVPNANTDAESITGYANAEGADLLVVGTHQRHGIDLLAAGSVAREVVRAAQVPVLVVPVASKLGEQTLVPRIRTVVAATDLSSVSNRVVPYAYALAGPGSTVLLCHILKRGAEGQEAIERKLRTLVPDDAAMRGIVTQTIVREADDIPQAIVDIAERVEADAVVIGARERSQVAQALTGTMAERILRAPGLPLFVVRTRKA